MRDTRVIYDEIGPFEDERHRHRCKGCGCVWEHWLSESVSNEMAHKCPECGLPEWMPCAEVPFKESDPKPQYHDHHKNCEEVQKCLS